MRYALSLLFLAFAAFPAFAQQAAPTVEVPVLVLRGVPFTVTVQAPDSATYALRVGDAAYPLVRDAETGALVASGVEVEAGGTPVVVTRGGAAVAEATPRSVPGWFSILPPLLAIIVALVFKRVIPALFLGIWVGAWMIHSFDLGGMLWGVLEAFQVFILQALANPDHAAILLFSLMIGGMVGVISKNGGTYGIVNHIVKYASNAQRGQAATAILGLVIFFDDYANTLVVGNTMRPVTDRLRISREKLAYLVDSTAAPVACLALVTTWIGYQVGLVGTAVEKIPGLTEAPYSIFLNSIPYSFYPVFTLFFLFIIANSRRDFGPMHAAEMRARTTGKVLGDDARVDSSAEGDGEVLAPKAHKPQRAFNAIVPVAVLVFGVLAGLYYTGITNPDRPGDTIRDVIGAADSYRSLMWASLASVLVAMGLSVGQKILTLDETMDAWYNGMKSMLLAMIILVMAWALSAVTESLHTADFLTTLLSGALHPGVVPALVFILAAATAFATGTSWGTMGILMPLVVPLAWGVLEADGLHTQGDYLHILYSTVSAVLAGAVWGDHCSPISDTTILSSMASGCDHIAHVRTQLPYALSVGVVSILVGTLPTGFGFPWWASMIIGLTILSVGIRLVTKPIPRYSPAEGLEDLDGFAASKN